MKKFLMLSLVGLLLLSLLAGGVLSSPVYAGEKILRRGGDFGADGHIDAMKSTFGRVSMPYRHVVEPLMGQRPFTYEMYPLLVVDIPTVSDDGLTYSFELKRGIKFSDGQELTSADVEYTFNTFFDPATNCLNTWMIDFILGAKEMMEGKADSLAGFKVIDDYRFEITLESPYAAFPRALANDYLGIVPKGAHSAAGDRWGIDILVGTGPYTLESFDPTTKIVFAANPNYNHNVYNGRTLKARVDKVEFYNMDENTRYLEFEVGNLDHTPLDLTMAQEYLNRPEYAENVQIENGLSQMFFVMNNSMKPFDNVKVREAVAYAFDNTKIAEIFFMNLWPVANTILPEGVPGHDDFAGYEYNPEKAKQLLAEAGYPNGIEFEMTVSGTGIAYHLLQIMQQDFAECNMFTTIDQVESGVWFDKRSTGNVQSFLGTWGPSFPNPDTFLYGFFHSSSADFLSTGHRNPEYDAKVMAARAITDPDEAQAVYNELERYLSREAFVAIPGFNQPSVFLLQSRVTDVVDGAQDGLLFAGLAD
ncbi:MAG: ABC transporter substrate-binding protein [Firmicutes bacterium]|nr:ABC transporter substrate-binding protein [Bacillota bacterium]